MEITIGSLTASAPGKESEVQMVKSALLYGDRVKLISPVTLVIKEILELENRPSDEAIEVYLELMATRGEDAAKALRRFRALKRRPNLTQDEIRTLHQIRQLIRPQLKNFRAMVLEKLEADWGLRQMQPAVDSGLLTIETIAGRTPLDDIMSAMKSGAWSVSIPMAAGMSTALFSLMVTGQAYPLFDEYVAGLLRPMMSKSTLSPTRRSNLANAPTATNFVSRVPSFDEATVEEIIDIRSALQPALTRFRQKVSEMASSFQMDPTDPDFPLELDRLYQEVVAPAVAEIDSLVEQNQLHERILGRVARANVARTGGMLSLGVAGLWQIPALISGVEPSTIQQAAVPTGLAGVAALALGTVIQESLRQRTETKRIEDAQFFFLRHTNELLS
jgi:hypothetical protein